MIFSLLKDGYPTFQKYAPSFHLRHAPLTEHSHRSSRKMIFRLIVLTINTGLWTAVFAIVDLVLVRPPRDPQSRVVGLTR